MGFNLKSYATVLAFAAVVSPAMADSFLEQLRPGSEGSLDDYFALDIGRSKVNICAGITGCEETATLYRVALGTQITPMWGAEISYADIGKASAGTLASTSIDWQINALQVSGTGIFPLSDAFSLIGKLGEARTYVNLKGGGAYASEAKNSLAFGIGAQYRLSKSAAIRVLYEDFGTTKVKLHSAGIVLGLGY